MGTQAREYDEFVTVWEFTSVDGKQRVTRIRPHHSDDARFQHAYQRILYVGWKSEYKSA